MLILWEYSDDLSNFQRNAGTDSAVSELLRCYRLGHHLLVFDRRICDFILREFDLSGQEIAAVRRLRGDFTQSGSLHTSAPIHIRINTSAACKITANNVYISVPLVEFSSGSLASKAVLLIENLTNDGWLYASLIDYSRGRLHRLNAGVDLFHGGGSSVRQVLSHLVTQGRIVCTVIDSDRVTPLSAEGQKVIDIKNDIAKVGWPLAMILCPPCRELENLIPMEVIMQVPSGISSSGNSVLLDIAEAEEKYGHDYSDRFWLFFDCKLGLEETDLVRFSQAERAWINGKLNLVGIDVNSAWSIEGYGDKVINQIKVDNAHRASLRSAVREKIWCEGFGVFVERLAWMFACAPTLRT